MVRAVTESVPAPEEFDSPADRESTERALAYMGLQAGTPIEQIALDRVFIGSCTNSRIGDLRAAAKVVEGRKVAQSVDAMVVPGSQQVKKQAEAEGLDRVFREAGFDWRVAGCSMCLGMNPDILQPGERCASTSNRNFEGRQGRGGRHLFPANAAPRHRRSADGRAGRRTRRSQERDLVYDRDHPASWQPGRADLLMRPDRATDGPDKRTAPSAISTAPTSTPTRSCPSSF